MTMTMPDSYISYFTPGEMSHETLEFILVRRGKLIERLVDRVRDSVLTAAKHQSLVLGPRGMGKSFVVALVYHRVKALPELTGKIALAWLPEDEWGVASLADLYMVFLEALEREYGGLRTRIDALFDLPMTERADAARTLLRDYVGDRTLFLLVENLEEIFRGLSGDELWTFRSFLSKTPFATILATSPSLFSGVARQQEAFYGFFQTTYLDELTVEEATELLGKLAERRGDTALANFLKTPTAQDRVQAVHDLAGGHPRLYLLFAHLLTQSGLDELVTPFLEFLDELTPYFQDRMKSLSPQQRKIITFLCDRRGAVAVKEIAARTNGMTSQVVSAQLDKLDEMGYVVRNPVGREAHYELREPLLRMVIEKKRGRGELLRLVIDFLRRWYSRAERRARLSLAVHHDKLYWEASLDLNRAMEDVPDPSRADELLPEYWEAFSEGDFARAAEIAAEIIERRGQYCTAEDWAEHAYCLDKSENFNEALLSYDKAVMLDSDLPFVWSNRGNTFYRLGRYVEAIESYHKSIEIDADEASVWTSSGTTLYMTDQFAESLASFDKAIKLSPNYSDAWTNRGVVLMSLGQYATALESFDRALALDSEDALAWFNRAEIYLLQNRLTDFIATLSGGFLHIDPQYPWRGETWTYCSILIEHRLDDELELVTKITELYTSQRAEEHLGQGLIESIPALMEPEISDERAASWLAAWQAAGAGKPDMIIPLRILAAAVAWKPKRDVRALLTLALEERRILVSLLPEASAKGAAAGAKGKR